MAKRAASRHGRCPARWKVHTAVAQPITIGSRFEAFATTGPTPIMIMIGRVTAEPLDAAVLRNAATTPVRIRIRASVNGCARAKTWPLLTHTSAVSGAVFRRPAGPSGADRVAPPGS